MFDPTRIGGHNQMEYPVRQAYKLGYRGRDPVAAYAANARKLSLPDAGVLEPSELPAAPDQRHERRDLPDRGQPHRRHPGQPEPCGQRGAESILYAWIDDVVAGKP